MEQEQQIVNLLFFKILLKTKEEPAGRVQPPLTFA